MRRILLVRPLCNKPVDITMPPLGMMYVASYLRRRGDVDVRIVDLPVAGLGYEGLEPEIRRSAPDAVGVGALAFESRGMHRIAAIAKRVDPRLPVICGGPYPSAYTERVMADPNVDFAVIGEGETTADGIVTALREGSGFERINGLAWREGDIVRVNPRTRYVDDLDAMPFPAWDLVDLGAYPARFDRMSRTGVGRYMPVFTSRACPFGCVYCHGVFGKGYRARSAEGVVSELRRLHDGHGVREFEIVDDCFNYDLERAKDVFRGIIASGLSVELTFPAALRGDLLDEEFFALARRAGVVFIAFAVETASTRLQRMLRKNLDLDKVERSIGLARRHGIFCQGFFMIGFPTETREEIEATVDFACRSRLNAINLLMVTAFEGSELAGIAARAGKPVYGDFDQNYMSWGFSNLTDLPDATIQRIRLQALARFWLDPRRMLSFGRAYPHKERLPHLAGILARRLLLRV